MYNLNLKKTAKLLTEFGHKRSIFMHWYCMRPFQAILITLSIL